jgi:hypothetical protein
MPMPPAPPHPSLARRIAVTVAAVVILAAGRRLRLPVIDEGAYHLLGNLESREVLSPLALGLNPFVTAFLLVEVLSLVHPAWRSLRHGLAGRRALTRVVWGVALGFAALQGWGIAVYLQRTRGPSGDALLEYGLGPALALTATLVAGSLAAGGAAVLVSRHGVGNGFAVLLAAAVLEGLLRGARALLALPRGAFGELHILLALALVVVVPLVVARRRREAREGPLLPVPTCGLAVAQAPSAVLRFAAALALWVPAAEPVSRALHGSGWLLVGLDVALVLALGALFARLFCPPEGVVGAFRRASPAGGGDADAAIGAALRAANRRSVGLVVAVALVPTAAALLGVPVHVSAELLVALAAVAAVAWDVQGELAARGGGRALESALPVHRVYAVAPAMDALAAAGIPAFPRALRYRTLFHFFAPWAPVEILVPPERREEAEAVCSRVVGGGPVPEPAPVG